MPKLTWKKLMEKDCGEWSSRQLTLKKGAPRQQVWDLLWVQLASYLEGGPMMWMMPLHLHVYQKSDYGDGDRSRSGIIVIIFLFISLNICFRCSKPFFKTVLLSIHTICFGWKITKLCFFNYSFMGERSTFLKSWTFKTPIFKLGVYPLNIHNFKTVNKSEKLLWSP